MEKEIVYMCKAYLKSGVVVEDEIIFDESVEIEEIKKFIEELRHKIKQGLKESSDFQFTFGFTIFRGSEIAAVKIYQKD